MKIGLRVDVDTFRGTRLGVPNICRLLEKYSIKASIFFSVGPDNMGRHLWRLLRPTFLKKMLRTEASSLYGWDILLKGTLWPGPLIGKKLAEIIRTTSNAGHEIGLHAWDHHAWQAHIDTMNSKTIFDSLNKGVTVLTQILGYPPDCSAVPGWKSNDLVLKEKSKFPFHYNSDCRGHSIFQPIVSGTQLTQPQIPVTLPTYDEVIGRNGITDSNYNDYLVSLLGQERLNVLTIHAEVEGIAYLEMFHLFPSESYSKNIMQINHLPSSRKKFPGVKDGYHAKNESKLDFADVCCHVIR
ncbi:MAG: polysaccharide deacetylase family protein [Sedimentisphaerales bacterium]